MGRFSTRLTHHLHSIVLCSGTAVCAFWTIGCIGLRPTPTPMPSEVVHDSSSPCAVVFLPGMFDKPRDFARQGFDAAVAEARLDLHLVAADAHFGYYRKRSILDRLRQDVVLPLISDGKRVWLVGISLGGAGSLLYGRDHGDELAGLVLLAPFVGNDEVIEELERQGGPLTWKPPEAFADGDVGRRIWTWLQIWYREERSRPAIYLGYGERDDLAPGHRLLAELIPEDHVARHPAGHDWDAWLPLWREILNSDTFAGC